MLEVLLPSSSYLEWAFLKWVLAPATRGDIAAVTKAQAPVTVDGRSYLVDYVIQGESVQIAVELDGYQFHSSRPSFTYDRIRQNDLAGAGFQVVRFSYEAIASRTSLCVEQLQVVMAQDPLLSQLIDPEPQIEQPQMEADPRAALLPSPETVTAEGYFDLARTALDFTPLRNCQAEAFGALASYYAHGGRKAACVMSVGAGKTTLGVAACLGFARRRAMIVTPGSVIRSTFTEALDGSKPGNSLYGLKGGPLIGGVEQPRVLTLDASERTISSIERSELLEADIIVTNFHTLGQPDDEGGLLGKLAPDDIDLLVVDEAHIAAADSYQRTFSHFEDARMLLMSACFDRADGKPIEADVVYRYRLIDAIADGHAKQLRVSRFAPDAEQTEYQVTWPDGRVQDIVGREAILEVLEDPARLASVTAKSPQSIAQVMRATRAALDRQARELSPVKPRVLFSAIGEAHAEQVAEIARQEGIATAHLHYRMGEAQIRDIRAAFETDSGPLEGLVHLQMLGQGYDFPPICVVVPMRPYGSFADFYQFVGRGIRSISGLPEGEQWLDVIYHAELGLDEHLQTIYAENDMDPIQEEVPQGFAGGVEVGQEPGQPMAGPEAFVVFEQGQIQEKELHEATLIEQRRLEREQQVLAQRYAAYAASSPAPVSFEQYVQVIRQAHG